MKSLSIKDLSVTSELDHGAMSAVRGGTSKGLSNCSPCSYWNPSTSISKNDFNFDATQSLNQSQNTLVNNGNDAAFVSGITSNVHPSQTGKNTINFG